MVLTLKQALRAEEAGGVVTGMSSQRAATLLAQPEVQAQPHLHKLMVAAHAHALALEQLGRVLEEVRNSPEATAVAQSVEPPCV